MSDATPKHRVLPGLVLILLLIVCGQPQAGGQTGASASAQQTPQTAPQVKQVLPSYEGQTVTTVELAGQPGIDEQALKLELPLRGGQPFAQSKVDESMAMLKELHRFPGVELEIRPEAEGIRVLFVLQPAVYFGVYEFPGALGRFAYSRLLQIADYPPRGAYTPVDVSTAQQRLERFFKRNGYFQATVEPSLQVDKEHGIANVFFRTTLGPRAKFGKLNITGVDAEQTGRLRGALHSLMAWLKSSSIKEGKTYSRKRLQNATQYLESTLMDQDHLAARVKLIGAEYDPATNRADVTFHVEEGPLVQAEVKGTHLWSWTKHRLLPIYQQNGLDPELIQEGRQNLLAYLQKKGYFDAKVDTRVQKNGANQSIVYQVTKGPRHHVEDVRIVGNDHIDGNALMPHVEVDKAHLLGHGKYSKKLAQRSVRNLEQFYQANGYSEVKVTPQVTQDQGDLVVTFRVDEGRQDIVESLSIEGNDTVPESQLTEKPLKLGPGQPYSAKLVNDDRNHILANYLQKGYLNASFRASAHEVNKDPHRLAVVYQIHEGPRVITASVVQLGREVTRPELIARLNEIKPEDPLREDLMLKSESELYNLGIFDWAAVDPRRQVTTQNEEDVLLKVHEAKRNQITYGFGFEVINRGGSVPSGTVALPGLPPVGLPSSFKTSEKTFWGPRGQVEYTRKNIRGRAETLTLSALAGRLDQHGQVQFTDPYVRGTEWKSQVQLLCEHDSQNPIYTSRLGQFTYELQHALNADKTQNVFLQYRFKQTGLTRLLIPDLIPPEDLHVRLSTLSVSYVRDTRDNVLDATKGIYETFELGVSPSALGSSVTFAKLRAQTAYYRKVIKGIVWANSLRLGFAQPFAGSHIPLSEKFFSGGGSTLRGFPLNGAGPQRSIPACGDPNDVSTCSLITVPVGGNELFIVNSELRVPINYDLPLAGKNLGVVAFYDGGNIYPSVGFRQFGALYSNTVGFGLRYKTPVGPVRIDIGHNLSPHPGIKSTQLFITLGQAF